MKRIPITEHEHQCQVIDWCEIMAKGKYPMLQWIHAIPNGARTARSTANKLKAEGMKAGVPDLCLPYPTEFLIDGQGGKRTLYHGLYIEMKSKDTRGRLSTDQRAWIEYLGSVGYKVVTAWTAEEAIRAIEEYLNGN